MDFFDLLHNHVLFLIILNSTLSSRLTLQFHPPLLPGPIFPSLLSNSVRFSIFFYVLFPLRVFKRFITQISYVTFYCYTWNLSSSLPGNLLVLMFYKSYLNLGRDKRMMHKIQHVAFSMYKP